MPILDPSLTPESIRAAMAIPSTDRMRGLKDGVGFATTPEAMAAVFEASARGPAPTSLGPDPEGPVVGAICPHDDFLYAGRLYRKALERIEARTVIIVGVFHEYRKFNPRVVRFDSYESWWTPDGPARVSPMRESIAQHPHVPPYLVEDAAHDIEHSIEPIVAWLKHQRTDREIVPILAPALDPDRIATLALFLANRIGEWIRKERLEWGRDVALVISADAIHYGEDFNELRFGPGSVNAHELATREDRRILTEVLKPEEKGILVALELMELLLEDIVQPDAYRWTWCGRYSIPFGILLLDYLAGPGRVLQAWPLAYETSMSAPPLNVHMPPLGFTAPASYDHFVGYPAVAFTFASSAKA